MVNSMRVGNGFDVHKFQKGLPLILGGLEIPYDQGLEGHSDADVLLHAVADALLGAVALGDLGQHFPDKDGRFKNISSRTLLEKVKKLLSEENYQIINIDATIIAEQPKLAPYIEGMRKNIAYDLHTELEQISVKATTSEGLGFEGEELGISAQAVALISKIDK